VFQSVKISTKNPNFCIIIYLRFNGFLKIMDHLIFHSPVRFFLNAGNSAVIKISNELAR